MIEKKLLLILTLSASLMANGILVKESCLSVSETANNIKDIVSKQGLCIFTIIDHSGNAKIVDMKPNES